VQAEDRELFEDIMPFVSARYRIRSGAKNQALAGLSMGGYQTVYTGLSIPTRFQPWVFLAPGFSVYLICWNRP
jgi:enterochelin esterase-like enzyme